MKKILCAVFAAVMLISCGGSDVEKYASWLEDNMSLADSLCYPHEYWVENARIALDVRRKAAWKVPEREFRRYVLPVRVNNEMLDSFRIKYTAELCARVAGLPAADAALEVNHWCHEMATYKPSDGRTSSPMQTIGRGVGRCGEESVLGVAAMRAVGIPARQVYTPRWAHTDDNHAWIEVYVDGRWWFLGACEPEPRLDMAWFNAPVSRAMLLHTKTFGRDYDGPEDVISETPAYTEINVTPGYVSTRTTSVRVLDEEGRQVEGAEVEFTIYNYAEFYPVAKYISRADGPLTLRTGCGDMLIRASKDGRYGMAVTDSSGCAAVVLDHVVGVPASMDFSIVPPAENPILTDATEAEVAANAVRLRQEDSIRAARPKENVAVRDFLARNAGAPAAQALVNSLSEKDRGDVTAAVLDDAFAHCGGEFVPARDCPRVELEPLWPYFEEMRSGLLQEGLDFASKEEVAAWVEENVQVDDSANPQHLRIPPAVVWRSRRADALSRDIFYVALCRASGFEALYDAVNASVEAHGPEGTLHLEFEPGEWLEDPEYYRHFTITRIGPDGWQLLNYDDNSGWPLSALGDITLEEGDYMLTSGVRMADGSADVHVEIFHISAGATTDVPLIFENSSDKLAVIGGMDAESLFLPDGANAEKSILSTLGRGFFLIAILGDKDEPTSHAVAGLSAVADDINRWGRPVLVLGGARPGGLEHMCTGTDPGDRNLRMIAEGCGSTSTRKPVVAICDSFGRTVFFSQGYDTSLGENLRRALDNL